MEKITFGVVVGTRGFFPSALAVEGRKQLIEKLEKMGFGVIIAPEGATPHGAVETSADALVYSHLFHDKKDIIDGIIVSLPNFGDELGIVETIEKAALNVPVLVHASDDRLAELDIPRRRDSFCGKLSVCNNFYQRGIKFTNTTLHTCLIESESFSADLERFSKVCRVIRGLRGSRIAAIGQRPNPFNTVRYSEKLLQDSGITVVTVDLSEIIFAAIEMGDKGSIKDKIRDIKEYGAIEKGIPEDNVEKSAKLSLAVEKWINDNNVDASAIQCWDSIQKNYGCATCLTMSMMGEAGKPSACETDVMGALSMYALFLASGEPSGFLDWNNNFDDDRDMCINIHCSNYPKSFFGGDFEIGALDILGESLGKNRCFGGLKGQVKAGPMTYLRISTDDKKGKIKAYFGEGEFTDDPVNTVGGIAVCRVPNLQVLLDYMCKNGFEHHVAMNKANIAGVLEEALGNYLNWDLYYHNKTC